MQRGTLNAERMAHRKMAQEARARHVREKQRGKNRTPAFPQNTQKLERKHSCRSLYRQWQRNQENRNRIQHFRVNYTDQNSKDFFFFTGLYVCRKPYCFFFFAGLTHFYKRSFKSYARDTSRNGRVKGRLRRVDGLLMRAIASILYKESTQKPLIWAFSRVE